MRPGIVAALLLLVPLSAAAQEVGPIYTGLRGSLAFSGSSHTSIPSTSPPTSLRASSDVGGGASIFIGTHLPAGFRVEMEGLYRYLRIDKLNVNGSVLPGHGQAHIAAPMVNLFWDLPVPEFPIRPFIGAGLGGAYVSAKMTDNNGIDYFKPSSWQFAYQLMGGAAIPLSDTSRLTAMYRWIDMSNVGKKCGTSGVLTDLCTGNLSSQSIDLGLEMDL